MNSPFGDRLGAAISGLGLVLLLAERSASLSAATAAFLPWVQGAVFAVLGVHAATRLSARGDRRRWLRTHWPELLAWVPFLRLAGWPADESVWVVLRLAVLSTVLVAHARQAIRDAPSGVKPASVLLGAFALAIASGAVLLSLPAAASGGRLGLLDAVFMATSATCVTGLTVVDTASRLSVAGQGVVLALIQAGGLGIMTFSAVFAFLLGRKLDIGGRVVLHDALGTGQLAGLRRQVLLIVGMTAALELTGALALYAAWRPAAGAGGRAAYDAVFHSVSAFCNAGFSTFDGGLARYRDDPFTLLVIGLLIVAGGLGFAVIQDLARYAAALFGRRAARPRLRMQTRVVLVVSMGLTAAGAWLLYGFERDRAFAGNPPGIGMLTALFHSVSARTAGFNTWDVGGFSTASLFTLMVLMFIGASPGSTGGGIKTTSFAVLWATVASELRGRPQPELFRRTIPTDVVRRAASLLCLSLVVVGGFALLLVSAEKQAFRDVLFEAVSAFGTVGLSVGVTPQLTPAGKALVTALMFVGRVGPLTMACALMQRPQRARYVYAEERLTVG